MQYDKIFLSAVGVTSMEERADGQAQMEIEISYYARISDLAQFSKARSWEHQEQWQLKVPKTPLNGGSGSIRIRKTIIPGAGTEYVMTTKTDSGREGDKLETPIPTTEANFEQFKMLCEGGMKKDRYFFPVENSDLVWEIDMFHAPDSTDQARKYLDWCKLDLELPNREVQIPHIPIAFEEIITAQYGHRTPEEEAQVSKLYEEDFVMKNPMGKPTVEI
jgi:hypothetical protein